VKFNRRVPSGSTRLAVNESESVESVSEPFSEVVPSSLELRWRGPDDHQAAFHVLILTRGADVLLGDVPFEAAPVPTCPTPTPRQRASWGRCWTPSALRSPSRQGVC
jgi:hypothetical protein